MNRFLILFGFALMFSFIHLNGDLNKYINTKYSYLSVIAIVLFGLLSLVEFVRFYRQESEAERRKSRKIEDDSHPDAGDGTNVSRNENDNPHDHYHHHDQHHPDHHHDVQHHPDHHHDDDFGHTHESSSKWRRGLGYAILFVPILAGIFLPVATLDSSFVKAKGFAFPQFEATQDNPGQHQFLKPDTSVYYGTEGYAEVKNKDYSEFKNLSKIDLTDQNYLKGMEVLYNFPGSFMSRTISFTGFAYKGEQVDENHYFVFRFGFIHCAADSGVFGMLADFPKNTALQNDQWVQVSGQLTWELYQPFKQTIPVLKVSEWKTIPAPKDPYVYRNY